jgi:hypothetical protein
MTLHKEGVAATERFSKDAISNATSHGIRSNTGIDQTGKTTALMVDLRRQRTCHYALGLPQAHHRCILMVYERTSSAGSAPRNRNLAGGWPAGRHRLAVPRH